MSEELVPDLGKPHSVKETSENDFGTDGSDMGVGELINKTFGGKILGAFQIEKGKLAGRIGVDKGTGPIKQTLNFIGVFGRSQTVNDPKTVAFVDDLDADRTASITLLPDKHAPIIFRDTQIENLCIVRISCFSHNRRSQEADNRRLF